MIAFESHNGSVDITKKMARLMAQQLEQINSLIVAQTYHLPLFYMHAD